MNSTTFRPLRKSLIFLALCAMLLIPPIMPSPMIVKAQESSIFKVVLLVPQPNLARQAWSLIVQDNLESLGIEVGRVVLDFGTIGSRTFQPNPDVAGKTYDEGGYDILFVGYGLTLDADPWSLYHSSQFAPAGQNFYFWNNSLNDQLTTQIKETVDKTTRLNLVRQWQELAFEELPAISILYAKEIVAHDATIANGEDVFLDYHFPAWPPIEHISLVGTADSLILAQTGPAPDEGLIPMLSVSYYDSTAFAPIYNGLAVRNDTTFKNMIPALASDWSVASDQKTWTVNLRPSVKWHDYLTCTPQPNCGNFDAMDVKFTYDAVQDPDVGSPIQGFFEAIIGGKDNVVVVDADTVQFNLPAPYAYFVENILTLSILPQHILNLIPLADWDTSSFNTGQGGPGPVGTGPYKWVDYTPTTETVHLTKNLNYFDFPDKGNAALVAKGQYEVVDYFVRHLAGTDAAITAFRGGQVNVLDSQYHLEAVPSFLAEIGDSRWIDYDALGAQEMSVNMNHPIFGTGANTPLGRQTPSRATEAARYVRQAISHAVPRDLIIQQLLNGFANPGITTPVVGNSQTGFAVTEGFNTDLQPYQYNLTRSRELLQRAGYFQQTPVHDVAVTGIDLSSTSVAHGSPVTITVNVQNQGNSAETFTVSAYAEDALAAPPKAVQNLEPNASTELVFQWDTGGALPGEYTIMAQASPVPEEVDVEDNTLIDGSVTVALSALVLSVDASGEFDYLFREQVRIRIAATVTDTSTGNHVFDANVTMQLYDPDNKLLISDSMVENTPGSGIYEWTSSRTVAQLGLRRGVYLVRVQASAQGSSAQDVVLFHVDPPAEAEANYGIMLSAALGAVAVTAAIGFIVRKRFWPRHKTRPNNVPGDSALETRHSPML